MKKFVIDTSVIIKYLSEEEEFHLKNANELIQQVEEGNLELFAPELVKYEVGNVLLKGKKLSATAGKQSLHNFYLLPIRLIQESEDLAKETYKLAHGYDLTYHDASFLALAKTLESPLITENFKHQGKVKSVEVVPLGEYH